MLIPIPHWDVAAIWDVVEPHLRRAIDRQHKLRVEDIKSYCEQNLMQLWYVPGHGAFVTQIQNYPLCRVCLLLLCGGSGMELKRELQDGLEAYARAMKCDEIEIQGRRGWLRVTGYEETHTVMRKKL